ncbi:MAG: NAD(P)-binding protein [Sulfurimonadaceae bacterium]|jgi:phytoene dehydrogenase-like protein|nr:NAD(P)-binding protein [Sulfurimonadaceae bacterium]
MFDFAVVGSGVGGSSIAAYLHAKNHKVILFEKEPYLGGCSSTFIHKLQRYNTGATTFALYQEKGVVKELFDSFGFIPSLVKSDPSIVVIQGDKTTPRVKDFESFLEVIEQNYPHPKNREFWTLIYQLGNAFYDCRGHYYETSSWVKKIKSLFSFLPLFKRFWRYLCIDGEKFINHFYGEISEEYKLFLESQVMIVTQAPMHKSNFFSVAVALGYTFGDNYYIKGGMGKIFDAMTDNIPDVMRRTEIKKIIKHDGYFELHAKMQIFTAKKVILNSTIYDSEKFFDEGSIKNYYKKFKKKDNHQSSFIVYMKIKTDKTFHHHYQIIKEEKFPSTISQALFVSLSDKEDRLMAEEGYYSLTASVHTMSFYWDNPAVYKQQKEELQEILQRVILEILGIKESEVEECFSATPKTFLHYINREQLGGNPITMKNFLPFLPGNDTPIKGLYHVGDSVYPAQGWPGVVMGVQNTIRLLDA